MRGKPLTFPYMNSIKFRIRDGQKLIYQNHNGWFEGVNVKGYSDLQTITLTTACKPKYGLTVEQFTTISDKNKTEVYKGDEVFNKGITYKVQLLQGCFIAICHQGKNHNLQSICTEGEVISNIHQNQKQENEFYKNHHRPHTK